MGLAGESRWGLGGRWSDLPSQHRRWILYNAILITGFINFLMNAGITWLMVRGQHRVPLWTVPLPGRTNMITDTIGTFFMLPLITCLLVTTMLRHEVRVGRLAPLTRTPWPRSLIGRLPAGRLRRGAALGGICVAVMSLLCALVLVGVDSGGLSMGGFVVYKAVFGVVLGAIVTPVIALCAMADTAGSPGQGALGPHIGVRS